MTIAQNTNNKSIIDSVPTWAGIGPEEAKQFASDTLLSPSRTTPVVAVTTPATGQPPWIDPDDLAEKLGDRAKVVLLETGGATWALTAALPRRLDVYGGAARIWWPGLTRESDPFDHVLLLIRDEREAETARERILAAIIGEDPAAGRWARGESSAPRSSPPSASARDHAERTAARVAPPEETDAHLRRALQRERDINVKLNEELEAALDDRQRLVRQCEEHKQQAATARRELRGAEDRVRSLEARIAADDPLASETSFLTAVRVEYARRFGESDRSRYPLLMMRVGRSFLASLRSLQGVDVDKVVEVCAQVACGRAHQIPGRAVHELKNGAGRAHARASDNARAWRCALQIGSPSARRLHWWSIPQKGGPTVEFASVAVHDDFSIPG